MPILAPEYPLTLRSKKGSPLTHEEMDNNFKDLMIATCLVPEVGGKHLSAVLRGIKSPTVVSNEDITITVDTYFGQSQVFIFLIESDYSNVKINSTDYNRYLAFFNIDYDNSTVSIIPHSYSGTDEAYFISEQTPSHYVILTIDPEMSGSMSITISPTQYVMR